MNTLEAQLRTVCQSHGWPLPVPEFRFHSSRRWRFDYAWPSVKLAIEYDGLTRAGGRHQRMVGFSRDCEKLNSAALMGWIVLRLTSLSVNELPGLLEAGFAARINTTNEV